MIDSSSQDNLDRGTASPPADLRASVSDLMNAFYKGTSDEAARYDLTATQFNLLRVCFERGEECTATELAQVLPVDASRISRIISSLVDKGLLQRRRRFDDRRIVMLTLSEEGKELTSQILQELNLQDAMLAKGIQVEDMRVFVSVVSRMVANYTAIQRAE